MGVEVKEGIVTFTGTVRGGRPPRRRLPQVKLPDSYERNDTDIAQAVCGTRSNGTCSSL